MGIVCNQPFKQIFRCVLMCESTGLFSRSREKTAVGDFVCLMSMLLFVWNYALMGMQIPFKQIFRCVHVHHNLLRFPQCFIRKCLSLVIPQIEHLAICVELCFDGNADFRIILWLYLEYHPPLHFLPRILPDTLLQHCTRNRPQPFLYPRLRRRRPPKNG